MPSNDRKSKTRSSAYAKAPAKMPRILQPILPFSIASYITSLNRLNNFLLERFL